MDIHIITLFPEYFNCLQYGLVGTALKNSANVHLHQLRDFSTRDDRRIDDRPYGGGPGMVIQAQPIQSAREHILSISPNTQFIITDPKGTQFNQDVAMQLSQLPSMTILCGRYEGIDQRAYMDNDLILSTGDYVVSGGEIPALTIIDAVYRLLPGTLGNNQSHQCDSYQENLLDHPCYTRPEVWNNQKVPDVLTSGNHQDIEKWQRYQRLGLTWERRPDLIERACLSEGDKGLLKQYIEENSDVSTDSKN